MLEPLLVTPQKIEVFPQNTLPKPVNKQNSGSFSAVMDRTLSEQKALTRELEEGKAKETKKLSEGLKELKQSLKTLEQNPETDPKALETLKEIASYIEGILKEEVETSPLLAGLAASLLAFAGQAASELSETQSLSDGSRYMGEKIAFALEGLVQDIQANTLSLTQKDVIKEISVQAQAMASESRMHLARAEESEALPAFTTLMDEVSAEPKKILEESANLFSKQDQAKDQKESPIAFKDLRSSLGGMLKEQAVDAKFSQQAPQEDFSLFASAAPAKLEAALQKTEALFSPAALRGQIEAMMSQMSARAAYTLRDGGSEFKMKLTPPELGQMKVSFRMTDGIMQGKIVVSTPEAKALFDDNINLLKESLRQAGLDISHVDVSLGNPGDFGQAQDIIENGVQYKAVRTASFVSSPLEMMSRGLSMSEIDYTA